jgi:hypothetical protein
MVSRFRDARFSTKCIIRPHRSRAWRTVCLNNVRSDDVANIAYISASFYRICRVAHFGWKELGDAGTAISLVVRHHFRARCGCLSNWEKVRAIESVSKLYCAGSKVLALAKSCRGWLSGCD